MQTLRKHVQVSVIACMQPMMPVCMQRRKSPAHLRQPVSCTIQRSRDEFTYRYVKPWGTHL